MSYAVYPTVADPNLFHSQQIRYSYFQPHPVQQRYINQLTPPTTLTILPRLVAVPTYGSPNWGSYALTVLMVPVDQTANLLAYRQGWLEAGRYARDYECRSTQEMCSLTSSSEIGLLTANSDFETTSFKSADASGRRDGEATDTDSVFTDRVASSSGGGKSHYGMKNSECGRSDEVKEEVRASSLRVRRLLLNWSLDDQLSKEEQIKNFYLKFEKYDYKVEILSVPKRPSMFVVVFESILQAQKALLQAEKLGYDLVPKKLKGPTSKSPCEFKVLSKVTVREGRLEGKVVAEFFKDDLVYVNRIRGRRARLIKSQNDNLTLGWASLFTERGCPLLEQLDKDYVSHQKCDSMAL